MAKRHAKKLPYQNRPLADALRRVLRDKAPDKALEIKITTSKKEGRRKTRISLKCR